MKKHGTWQGAIAHKVELYYCDTAGYTITCKHPCLPSGSEKTERRREGYKKHSRVEAEEAAVDSQEVAAEGDAVPDAGLQEVQAGVGIYRGSALLEDGHYAAEDVASGTMFTADGAITLHNSLVTIQLDNAVENISAGDTEKDNVSYSQRAGIGQWFQFHGIPVSTYEGEHAHSLDGDGYILAFAEDPEDFREKYVIADNYFLHNCMPVYLRTIIQSYEKISTFVFPRGRRHLHGGQMTILKLRT